MAKKNDDINWGLFLAGIALLLLNGGYLLGAIPETVTLGSQQIAAQTSIMASSAIIGGLIALQRLF